MRIISGKFGGRRINLKLPDGIRPTSDNARESIFNILNNKIDFEGLTVLDLCAGTGAMGFEALSRGAGYCVFIEKSRKTTDFIQVIANTLKVPESDYEIVNIDAIKFFEKYSDIMPSEKFDLVFMDPPYKLAIVNEMLGFLDKLNILNDEALVITETGINYTVSAPTTFELLSNRNFGETTLNFFQYNSM